jgi:ABC-type amino acid transport substrate-binding protein
MKNLKLNVLMAALFACSLTKAQLSQTGNAATAANSATAPCGTFAWTNTANATGAINNGTVASATPTVGNSSNCLELTNGGFTIPAYAVITGIRVDIRRTASRSNVSDINVQLIKAGAKAGNNKATFNHRNLWW